MSLLKFKDPHLHFSVAKKAGCLGGKQHVVEEAENTGPLSESISMIMKCVLGSPWEESADAAALHGEFCHRMKEVGGKNMKKYQGCTSVLFCSIIAVPCVANGIAGKRTIESEIRPPALSMESVDAILAVHWVFPIECILYEIQFMSEFLSSSLYIPYHEYSVQHPR